MLIGIKLEGKDRKGGIRLLSLWGGSDGNWYPCGIRVHTGRKVGQKMEHLEADGPDMAMEGFGD